MKLARPFPPIFLISALSSSYHKGIALHCMSILPGIHKKGAATFESLDNEEKRKEEKIYEHIFL